MSLCAYMMSQCVHTRVDVFPCELTCLCAHTCPDVVSSSMYGLLSYVFRHVLLICACECEHADVVVCADVYTAVCACQMCGCAC